MQALQKKQQDAKAFREMMASSTTKTIEDRVEHAKFLQYVEHQPLFATMYSTIHKAANDNSVLGINYFLHQNGISSTRVGRKRSKVRVDDLDDAGFCPIHYAAEKGANAAIKCLLDNKCQVDVRSTYGNTALMQACKENRIESIALLMDAGADVGLFNRAGFSCIHFAAQGNHVESIQLIAELMQARTTTDDSPNERLDMASSINQTDSASLPLVASQESVDAPVINVDSHTIIVRIMSHASANRTTPLHVACLSNSLEVVQCLAELGVSLDYPDLAGDTALHKAGRKGYSHIYQLLRSLGASTSIKNNYGETPADVLSDNIVHY